MEIIDRSIREMGNEIYLPLKERLWLRTSLFDSFRRLDILQELIDDQEVSEVMVNGAGSVFVERNGRMELWNGDLRERNSWKTLSSRSSAG